MSDTPITEKAVTISDEAWIEVVGAVGWDEANENWSMLRAALEAALPIVLADRDTETAACIVTTPDPTPPSESEDTGLRERARQAIEQELDLAHRGEGYEAPAVAEALVRDYWPDTARLLAERDAEIGRLREQETVLRSENERLGHMAIDSDSAAEDAADEVLRLRREVARLSAKASLALPDDAVDERDAAEEWADRLAYAIAPVEVIGEHSSTNNPWANALRLLTAPATDPAPAAGEQTNPRQAELSGTVPQQFPALDEQTNADKLDDLLGIDPADPLHRAARALVESDGDLMTALADVRRAAGLTEKEAADRMGVPAGAVRALERPTADPLLSTVRRYALAIGAQVQHVVSSSAPQATAEPTEVPCGQVHDGVPCMAPRVHDTNGCWHHYGPDVDPAAHYLCDARRHVRGQVPCPHCRPIADRPGPAAREVDTAHPDTTEEG